MRVIFLLCLLVISSWNKGAAQDLSSQERYNEQGQLVATLDAYGNETSYIYDALERLIEIHYPAVLDVWNHPYRPIIKYAYNADNRIIEKIDPKGEKTIVHYHVCGKPATIVYPDGSQEEFDYFPNRVLKSKVMRDGIRFSFTLDEAGRMSCLEKRSASGTLLQTLYYTYQDDLLQTVTDKTAWTIRFLYDANGQHIGSNLETAEGTRHLDRKDKGFLEDFAIHEPKEAIGQFKEGKPADSLSSDFVFTQASIALNSLGQYVKQEERIDGYGIRHVLIYDALERLETLIKYNAMGAKLSEREIRYDMQGNKVLEKHHVTMDGNVSRLFYIRWSYDACKRCLAMTEGEQDHSKTVRYHYNSLGQLDQIIKPDGTTLFYTYHDNGQLEHFEASDGSFAYHYHYDHLQRLIAIHDLCHDIIQKRHYNTLQELTEDVLAPGLKVSHHYDVTGRRTGLTLPDSSKILYHYQGSLLSAIERLKTDQTSHYRHAYLYDSKGCLQACRLLGELGTVNFQYNQQGRLVTIQSPYWSQKIEEGGFDPYGRLLATSFQDNGGIFASQFTYTDDGQLAEEEGYQYAYDSLYNRISENGQGWNVNALNQLVQTPSASYHYNGNGDLIEKRSDNGSVFYTYDALDRLVRIEYPKEEAITYIYDAFDRRIEERILRWKQQAWHEQSLARFIYDGFKEIGKVNEQGDLLELRILGQGQGAEIGSAVALELDGKVFVPLHDSLGSVRCIINAEEGKVVENYRYTAYGKESLWDERGQPLENSLVGNPWRFCSKRVDTKTQLVFFGKRFYDPLVGRWMTPDPLFFYDSPNVYAFVKNDPLNQCDLYGLFSISQIWDKISTALFTCFDYLQISAHHAKTQLKAELQLSEDFDTVEKMVKALVGPLWYFLMNPDFEATHVGFYGQKEINDQVRVTFMNGMLNTSEDVFETLEAISRSHGGVKVHYVFRPTSGWTSDVAQAAVIKTGFALAEFRSKYANLLAQMWRALIQEMGGVEGGGTIVHYAHSLGGTETDRARELLSPAEQKMIRVVTFGSSTLVRNEGFQSVVNIVSISDGVSSFVLEPCGYIRNFFDPDSNVRLYGTFRSWPCWPSDHLFNGSTYAPTLRRLGEQFVAEFIPN